MRRHLSYFLYTWRHKYYVFLACRKLNVPLWRSIFHDWTKFTPSEWKGYSLKFWNKDGSKRDVATLNDTETATFRTSLAAHYRRNDHHPEFWVVLIRGTPFPMEMPDVCLREMAADFWGASMAKKGFNDVISYYTADRNSLPLHPKSRQIFEKYLNQLAPKSEPDLSFTPFSEAQPNFPQEILVKNLDGTKFAAYFTLVHGGYGIYVDNHFRGGKPEFFGEKNIIKTKLEWTSIHE